MFICTHCGEVSAQTFKRAGNAQAWAIGKVNTNGKFTIRAVRWTLHAAQLDKRIDEDIRLCLLMIENEDRRRPKTYRKPITPEEINDTQG